MIRRTEYSESGTPLFVEYAEQAPPRRLNSHYLQRMGFTSMPGNSYVKESITIKYDGVHWWFFKDAVAFKIETVEELEKLIA